MFGISPPSRLDECDWHTQHFFSSAAFQNIVEIMLVSIAILPCNLTLTASSFAWTFVIKIKSMLLRDFAKDVADKNFQNISDTLSPFVSE